MFSTRTGQLDLGFITQQLTAWGEESAPIEEKLRLVAAYRALGSANGPALDRFFVEEIVQLGAGIEGARRHQAELKQMLDRLTASPWHPGIFLGSAETEEGERAMVLHGNARRVVPLADGLSADALSVGDEVLLANNINVVLSRSPYQASRSGETALFERYASDDRAVIKWHDEECVVALAGDLANVDLKPGDRVRWDRTAWMAFEKLDRSDESNLFLEDTPAETFEALGGLDRQIDELQRTIALHLHHAETARRYRLRRCGSVLLVGPPGTGKTMMARALANWLATLSASGRARFVNIKPGSLHSVYYSQSEKHYREAFRVAREAGEREPDVPVVMFFDEVDSVGAARGESLMRVDDRVQTAFMTELDGLESRGNILVVAATNRRDAVDPALLRPGRLGDLVLEIPRPNAKGAAAIFGKYLGPDIPYADAGGTVATREELVAGAVSRIYAANGESDVAAITFRDGRRRMVSARDVISGASIAKMARVALERACRRDIETGESGVALCDLLAAIGEELEQAAQVLTPANCRAHLADLPQDVDVVRVEPVKRKVPRPHRYMAVA